MIYLYIYLALVVLGILVIAGSHGKTVRVHAPARLAGSFVGLGLLYMGGAFAPLFN